MANVHLLEIVLSDQSQDEWNLNKGLTDRIEKRQIFEWQKSNAEVGRRLLKVIGQNKYIGVARFP